MAIETECYPANPYIDALKAAIKEKTSCSGVLPAPTDQFYLFYGKGEHSRRLNITAATERELQDLANTCEPIAMGPICDGVIDDSFQKVRMLDPTQFASTLDLNGSGLMNLLQSEFLEGGNGQKYITPVLRRLTVYEKGASVSPDQDILCTEVTTESALGSLILILPTPHQGGSLLLQHGVKDWVYGSECLPNTRDPSQPLMGYVAFLNDVKYGVAPITSGHLVTLTYHLYLSTNGPCLPSAGVSVTPQAASLQSVLGELLKNPSFLPEGGILAFGLSHQYPFVQEINGVTDRYHRSHLLRTRSQNHDVLGNFIHTLKGIDATLFRFCQDLSLDASVQVVYRTRKATVMCDHIVDFGYQEIHEEEDVLIHAGGLIIEVTDHYQEYFQYRRDRSGKVPGSYTVHWVTPETPYNQIATPYVAYANRGSLGCIYGDLCLIVNVGKPGARNTLNIANAAGL